MSELIDQTVAQNRAGEPAALTSVCTAHADVLRACLYLARDLDQPLIIEATSNQVNQDGGYTGMQAVDFVRFARGLAEETGFDTSRMVLGGDHLGPQAWKSRDVAEAMAKARKLVADYTAAGFTKIHLDCSEGCAGEPAQLPDDVTASRAAQLAQSALDAAPDPDVLRFIIGTEVPPPGGAKVDEHGDIPPTKPNAARATLAAHRAAFGNAGLAEIWPQICGLVVQPGVEFSPMSVHHLPQDADPGLRAVMLEEPKVALEAHSTDYQLPSGYPRLAELGFAFLKVGPALTFAWREALYALDQMARYLDLGLTPLDKVMEAAMLASPGSWQGHYRGDDIRLQRHFGLADRIRYYWPQPDVEKAVAELFTALEGRNLPYPLLHQFFDDPLIEAAERLQETTPRALAMAKVQQALAPYLFPQEDV